MPMVERKLSRNHKLTVSREGKKRTPRCLFVPISGLTPAKLRPFFDRFDSPQRKSLHPLLVQSCFISAKMSSVDVSMPVIRDMSMTRTLGIGRGSKSFGGGPIVSTASNIVATYA